jgi:hypothetical protein
VSATYTREECAGFVEQVSRIMAKLYFALAREVVDELGEEKGKALLERAVVAFGRVRGEEMRARAIAAGAELNVANLGKFYDLPREVAWKNEVLRSGPDLVEKKALYCPFAEEWKRLGARAQELGRIYCQQDLSLRLAFNPEFVFEQFTNVLDDDPHCHTILRHRDTPAGDGD